MKKIILLGGALCVLASFPAGAGPYPQGAYGDRISLNDQYWQNRIDRARERERERDLERVREEARDKGHHYAYGKDPKHHKADWKNPHEEGWKNPSKHPGKSYGNKSYKHHDKKRPKDPNKRGNK